MHWYALSKTTGVATLCASAADARREAKAYDRLYPASAPHVATRLVQSDVRDTAMDTLRQIAAGKRRTREQRLALSCVTFLDECSNVPPNDQIQRAP